MQTFKCKLDWHHTDGAGCGYSGQCPITVGHGDGLPIVVHHQQLDWVKTLSSAAGAVEEQITRLEQKRKKEKSQWRNSTAN